ncbi:MAG: helical backbone metal receptor [Cyclobacteriaceae bacterium]
MSNLRTVTDQMGREVVVSFPPKRIISLVPSQTEFLIDIGVPVVGRTKFCIHPKEMINPIPVIGGTRKFRFDQIRKLKPDLIIGNKEENYQEGITQLAEEFPVWMSDIYTLEDAFEMMKNLGAICGRTAEAENVVEKCQESLEKVKGKYEGKVVYLIWKDPWMSAGTHTFINHMLHFLGYKNLVKEERYPVLSSDQIEKLNPDKILFSSEPYPFKEDHLEAAKNLWPKASCQLVDGELYSWYGSRMCSWQE